MNSIDLNINLNSPKDYMCSARFSSFSSIESPLGLGRTFGHAIMDLLSQNCFENSFIRSFVIHNDGIKEVSCFSLAGIFTVSISYLNSIRDDDIEVYFKSEAVEVIDDFIICQSLGTSEWKKIPAKKTNVLNLVR